MGRLLAVAGGITWLVAMGLLATAVQRFERPRVVPRLTTLPPLVRELNGGRGAAGTGEGTAWVVTRATSAHRVLVVDVNAVRVADARAIGAVLVDATVPRKYEEILIYVWSLESPKPFADRRIQWTPSEGLRELVIGD